MKKILIACIFVVIISIVSYTYKSRKIESDYSSQYSITISLLSKKIIETKDIPPKVCMVSDNCLKLQDSKKFKLTYQCADKSYSNKEKKFKKAGYTCFDVYVIYNKNTYSIIFLNLVDAKGSNISKIVKLSTNTDEILYSIGTYTAISEELIIHDFKDMVN